MVVPTIIGAIFVIVVLTAFAGRYNSRSHVTVEVRTLFAKSLASVGPEQLEARWDALPEPLRRYFRYAIPKDAPAIRTARMKHGGFFRTKPDQRWLSIEGEHYSTAAEPGFVWNASLRPMPLFWIEARDCLLAGRGNMLVKLVSLFTIADRSGPKIDQGARLRWLAENVWFPYAFVGDQIKWEAIHAHTARAALLHDRLPAGAVFEIDDNGELTSMHADRYRDVGSGLPVLTKWSGRYSDYREIYGFRVPTDVEVAWEFENGSFTYARFQLITLEYNISERF
jgi:Family of unknown function (DUF6544)